MEEDIDLVVVELLGRWEGDTGLLVARGIGLVVDLVGGIALVVEVGIDLVELVVLSCSGLVGVGIEVDQE